MLSPLQASSRKEIVAISLFTGRIYCTEFNIVNLKTISQKFTYARLFFEGYFWWRNIFSTSLYWYNTFEVVRISRIKDLPAHKIFKCKALETIRQKWFRFFLIKKKEKLICFCCVRTGEGLKPWHIGFKLPVMARSNDVL